MSHKHTAEFINKLSSDPKAREEYKKDPHAAMTKAGIPHETQAVLHRGNPEEIRKHLGDDAPPGCFLLFT